MQVASPTTFREAIHGNEPPLYAEDEREWTPSTVRVFEVKIPDDETDSYKDMIGIRIYLPAGVDETNASGFIAASRMATYSSARRYFPTLFSTQSFTMTLIIKKQRER